MEILLDYAMTFALIAGVIIVIIIITAVVSTLIPR